MKQLGSVLFSLFVIFSPQFSFSAEIKSWMNEFVQNNSQLNGLAKSTEAAELKYKARVATAFPEINFQATKTKQKTLSFDPTPDDLYTAGLSFTQAIYLGGRVWRGIDIERAQSDLTLYDSTEKSEALTKTFVELAVEWSLSQERLNTLKTSIRFQKSFVAITEKKLNKGNARPYEYHQNQANLLSYETRLLQLESQIKDLKESLLALLERSDSKLESLDKVVLNKEFIQSEKQLLDFALENNREVAIAKEQVNLANLNKSFEFGAHLPSLALEGSYGYTSFQSSDLFNEDFKTQRLTLSLTVPLFSGLSSLHQRKANQRLVTQAEKNLKSTLLTTKSRIESAYNRFVVFNKVFKKARQWDRSADKAFKNGRKNFNVGAIGNAQMLQLQIGREQAKMGYLDALKNFNMSIVELAFITGRPIASLVN